MSYTTADLLTAVRAKGMLPQASTGSLSDANLLRYATEELQSIIVPMILAAREKYYETYQDTVVTAGQALYPIPSRAIGSVLNAVHYLYGINIVPLNPIDASDAVQVNASVSPRGYYFQNNQIFLYPPPQSSNYSIRMRYFQRPNALDVVANAATISTFSSGANTVTVSAVPSSWAIGTLVDFIPQSLPYTPYGLSLAITNIAGNVLTFSALPAAIAAGDWIDTAEMTPVPEIPHEFFPTLTQATLCKALEAVGDMQNLQISKADLQVKAQNALKLITPRDQSGPKKIRSNWRNW